MLISPAPPRQIDSLTPLRGIAALLVLLYHLDSLLKLTHSGSLLRGTGVIARGYLWVDFFFVLSGFILTHVYGERLTEPRGQVSWKNVGDYFRGRFARIYPLHFFALTLTVLVYVGLIARMPSPGGDNGAGMAMIYDWKSLPFHYFLLISFGLTGMTWNIPAWSIGAEWWTYLLALPLFRALNQGVSGRTFLVPMLCSLGLWTLIVKHPPHNLDITFDFGLLRCFLDFMIGICLYQFYRSGTLSRLLASDRALAIFVLLTFLMLHFPPTGEFAPSTEHPPHLLTPVFDALSPLVFAGLILCAALNKTRGHRVLNVKSLVHLGNISYSVYLMQGNAFLVFFIGTGVWRQSHPTGNLEGLPLLLLVLVTVLFDLVIATATYRWVETPARKWLKGLPRQTVH